MSDIDLVLLPGLDGTGALFAPFARWCDSSPQVLELPADGPQDAENLARRLAPRLESLGRFVIVAESFSGAIAAILARSSPPGLVGAVFVATFARSPRPYATALAWLLPDRAFGLRPPRSFVCRTMLDRFSDDCLIDHVISTLRGVPCGTIAARFRTLRQLDIRPELSKIGIPCLYLRATRDRLVPRTAADDFLRHPNFHLAEVSGPHLLLQSRPSECVEAIRSFLRTLPG